VSFSYAMIEDEPPARRRLAKLIAELRPDSPCLGEAGDGVAGLALLEAVRPDVLFLDIEFPPEGAFGLLSRARDRGLELPPVVFCTAYGHHAVEAFRWEAWDYLLKPLARERLAATLDRIEARLLPRGDLDALLRSLDAARRQAPPERFTVLHKGRLRVLAWSEVSHLGTENRLLFVHAGGARYVLDRTLDELEKLLAPDFFRCHRGAMVALREVLELAPDAGGGGELVTRGGARLPVSRDRMPELRRRLSLP
jgi:DNA-binding LytR/AlgR family response regulator